MHFWYVLSLCARRLSDSEYEKFSASYEWVASWSLFSTLVRWARLLQLTNTIPASEAKSQKSLHFVPVHYPSDLPGGSNHAVPVVQRESTSHPMVAHSPPSPGHMSLTNPMWWGQTSFRVGRWWQPSILQVLEGARTAPALVIPRFSPQRRQGGLGGAWRLPLPLTSSLTTAPEILSIEIHSFIFKLSFSEYFL